MSVLLLPSVYYPTQRGEAAHTASEAAAPALATRLLGAWGILDGRADRWRDLTGRGADGTFTSVTVNTAWVPSQLSFLPGHWLSLAASGDLVTIGTPAHLANLFDGGASIVAAVTITAWGDGYPGIVSKQGTGATPGWSLHGQNDGAAIARLRFTCAFSGNDGVYVTPANSLPLNTPHVVGVSYTSSTTAPPTAMVIDGVSQTITVPTTPTGVRSDDTAQPVRAGLAWTAFGDFTGEIGLVLVFKPALEPQQLQALCFDPLAPFRQRARRWHRPGAGVVSSPAPRALHQYRLRRRA